MNKDSCFQDLTVSHLELPNSSVEVGTSVSCCMSGVGVGWP